MGVTQAVHGYRHGSLDNQSILDATAHYSSLAVVTGFLDAALRMWDDDHIQAKSQIKVAAAMLRGYTDDPVTSGRDAATASDKLSLAPWQTRKIREFIDASLGSTIRLQDCANLVHLSVSYFSRVFRATFGTPVGNYIRRRRIERAQQLMLLSNEPLAQIAQACGFADQAHYCRVFREVVGMSPNVWRRRNMRLPPEE
jgi:AraC family transcriptional regulator